MTHPLLLLSPSERHLLLVISLALTIIGILVLGFVDPGRVSGKGPRVVRFEIAGTGTAARQIVDDWGELGLTVTAFNLGFDYLFIVGYSTLMSLACLWAAQGFSRASLIGLGVFFAWLQWLAGAFDCGENASLLVMLFSRPSDTAAAIARVCALGKFGLLALGFIYVVSALF